MADKTGKTWMAVGETDDPNAIIETFEAAAAITKGDPVYLSADDKVSPAVADKECIGIATKTVSSGNPCPVLIRGRVKVTAGGATALGKYVKAADSSKRVLAWVHGTDAVDLILGWALEAAGATAGDLIFIYVCH